MATATHAPAAWHTAVSTSLGELTLVRDSYALRGVYFPQHWYMPNRAAFGEQVADGFDDASEQLSEYLAGTRRTFDLSLAPRGDELQRRVWKLVQQIAYGQTATYGELARALGGGVTAKQVGAAVGRNPLCILIPCHRVVGSGGKLTGYAGGFQRKRALLELEQTVEAAA
ncbi:MAG: methylated-DNA-[protein]-cysteine S-methyltransferase [Gaiellales bacterium]|nr:methylated-DNA-[protein]-cysteine S-methyltransferase [Gaiellales bacterium]